MTSYVLVFLFALYTRFLIGGDKMKPYGYLTISGWYGRLHDGSWQYFETEDEYVSFFRNEDC